MHHRFGGRVGVKGDPPPHPDLQRPGACRRSPSQFMLPVVTRAEYQRAWRAARQLRRGGEPHTWVRLRPVEVKWLRSLGSDRHIARLAQLSHHTVARALAGGKVFWSSTARLRALRP